MVNLFTIMKKQDLNNQINNYVIKILTFTQKLY